MWFTRIGAAGGYLTEVLGPALIAGAGLGTTLVSVITAATHDLGGDGETGLASGLVTTTNQLGGALGLAVLSTVAAARAGAAPAEAYRLAFGAAAGFAGAGFVIALLVVTGRSHPRSGPPAGSGAQPAGKPVAADRTRRLGSPHGSVHDGHGDRFPGRSRPAGQHPAAARPGPGRSRRLIPARHPRPPARRVAVWRCARVGTR